VTQQTNRLVIINRAQNPTPHNKPTNQNRIHRLSKTKKTSTEKTHTTSSQLAHNRPQRERKAHKQEPAKGEQHNSAAVSGRKPGR
jgi:hypothetical protein